MRFDMFLATLAAGFVVGYLAQRARMCLIGGVRDYYLIKDSYLLKGVVGFFAGALIVFAASSLFTNVPSWPWAHSTGFLPIPGAPISGPETVKAVPITVHVLLALLGGFGLGLFSVLAGGCPLRQHVMASEGNRNSMAYLLGFYIGAVVFHTLILPLITQLAGL
ncbi:MAG: YeeE/YedE thiosulfate transporter family protein [Nitrososphaerota archaeon]|nr:YeeE/YedE thiosulfate transporter family protein [Nitrososphaerota archaeon]